MNKFKLHTAMAVFLTATTLLAVNPSAVLADTAAENYSLYCVQCHGSAGTGKGINAPFLSVQPRNHTSAKDMGALSDENIAKAIEGGGLAVGKSNQMPPWGGIFAKAEIADLVKHLRGMCKCTYTPPPKK
tara:strand:+ start:33015 stop:33404 length:390 start_codon:yes stop_codon:yes gene_type:complete